MYDGCLFVIFGGQAQTHTVGGVRGDFDSSASSINLYEESWRRSLVLLSQQQNDTAIELRCFKRRVYAF